MTGPCEIHEVRREWILSQEVMGTKKKFWYRRPPVDSRAWLFKFPQADTGQHWAEKIAAQAAEVLGIRHARVELAIFDGERGSITESFARDGRELWHGNQVLAGYLHSYDPELRFRQSSHTLSNIWKALDHAFRRPDAAKQAKITVADYIVLDALIGNTDRHHENWGILRKRMGGRWRGYLAPSFDHASSLGRELLDARRQRLLDQARIGKYAERGRGGIYWSEAEVRAPSPLELVRHASCADPNLLAPALGRLARLDEQSVQDMVDSVPASWMTRPARRFAGALMLYNLAEMRKLIR